MIALLGAALASPREAGDEADARRDWPAALQAWRACAAEPGRDAPYCEARAKALAPQEADGFAGWDVLEGVRRDYRALGSDAAIQRIEAALASSPQSPAAPAMKLWLANERSRRGETGKVQELQADIAADPRSTDAERGFVARKVEAEQREQTRRSVAGLGAAVAAVYAAAAARGPGPWRWRSALVAAAVLGAVPTAFAAAYADGVADGFARSGGIVATAVVLAGRAPRWLSVLGTLGALAAVAWANGWMPSLGL